MTKRKFNVGDAVVLKSKSGWYEYQQGDTGIVHSTEYGYVYVIMDEVRNIRKSVHPKYFGSVMLDHFNIPILGDDDEDCI